MGQEQTGVTVTDAGVPSRWSLALWALLAFVAHLALLDAAVETFWSGSPLRWWVSPTLVVLTALSVWLWRPGGGLLSRLGPGSAAGSAALILLGMLTATSWLPGGQDAGLRMAAQSSSRLLAVALLVSVLLAVALLVRAAASLSGARRLGTWVLVLSVSAYAAAAIWVGVRESVPFATLFQGGAVWQRLPWWLQGTMLGLCVLLVPALLLRLGESYRRLRRKQSLSVALHQTTALALAVLMAISGILPQPQSLVSGTAGRSDDRTAPAAEPVAHPITAERGTRFRQTRRAMDAAEQTIRRDTFDPRTIVQTVGSDPSALFAWVRDHTYWVPYQGALRGDVGVLMDRVGSSLDRALLLARLLQLAGHHVRLAHARLSEADARARLAEIRPVPPDPLPQPADPTDSDIDKAAADLAKDNGLVAASLSANFKVAWSESKAQSARVKKRAAAQAAFLSGAVGTQQASTDGGGRAATAIADHWWVQWENGGRWVDLDVLLPGAQPDAALVAPTETVSLNEPGRELNLPKEYCHEVTIRVVIEQWSEGRVIERTANQATFRPADLVGNTIVIRNAPTKWPASVGFDPRKDANNPFASALRQQTEWLPEIIVGGRSFTQSTFTDSGQLGKWPPQDARHPGGGAADLFGGMFGEEDETSHSAGILTAEWIEYQIRTPGAATRTVRREVLDLLAPGSGQPRTGLGAPEAGDQTRLTRALELMHVVQVLPLVCRPSAAFVGSRALGDAKANEAATAKLLDRIAAGDTAGSLAEARNMKMTSEGLYALALARFEMSPAAQDVYLDTTNLLTYRTGLSGGDDGGIILRQGFDIVANDVAVRRESKKSEFLVRMIQGTADTNVEGLLQQSDATGNAAVKSGLEVNPGAWQTIRGSSDASWKGLGWSQEVRRRIEADLAAGYVVVAPRPVSGSREPRDCVWWRVDSRTGQTVGMGARGWGQALTENQIKILKVSLGFFIGGALAFDVCMGMKLSATRTGFFETREQSNEALSTCACKGLAAGLVTGSFVMGLLSGGVGFWLGASLMIGGWGKETFCG